MAHIVKRETEVLDEPDQVRHDDSTANSEYTMTVLERIVYFIGGFIIASIALRIILSLLGANRGNPFANLVYDVSYPFVAPFFGLFNYDAQYGVSRFEFESVVAIIVWGLITVAVARLVTIGSRSTSR